VSEASMKKGLVWGAIGCLRFVDFPIDKKKKHFEEK
jgi:hypothetical protein